MICFGGVFGGRRGEGGGGGGGCLQDVSCFSNCCFTSLVGMRGRKVDADPGCEFGKQLRVHHVTLLLLFSCSHSFK